VSTRVMSFTSQLRICAQLRRSAVDNKMAYFSVTIRVSRVRVTVSVRISCCLFWLDVGS